MSKPLAQAVAERVRAELAIQQISGAELARRMDRGDGRPVSQAYVWRRLNGETPFDVTELEQLAEILDVPWSRFLPAGDPAVTP